MMFDKTPFGSYNGEKAGELRLRMAVSPKPFNLIRIMPT